RKWTCRWVAGVDYPQREGRATVKGRLQLHDPLVAGKMSKLLVGLAHPAYVAPAGGGPGSAPREVDWQTDAKHYEFWVRGDAGGRFEIPNVRPGTYTLHAIADGVLGEFTRRDITVTPGQTLDLSTVAWTPVRRGRRGGHRVRRRSRRCRVRSPMRTSGSTLRRRRRGGAAGYLVRWRRGRRRRVRSRLRWRASRRARRRCGWRSAGRGDGRSRWRS